MGQGRSMLRPYGAWVVPGQSLRIVRYVTVFMEEYACIFLRIVYTYGRYGLQELAQT